MSSGPLNSAVDAGKAEAHVAPASLLQASPRRWLILWLLLLITIINFIDRQTVSILAPILRASLHLSNAQYGRIVAAFQFGMMTGEFPMGWLMDRWGVRFGLLGAVLWWSAATGTQTLTKSGLQLGLTRFWMGTGECGNYSGGLKALFGAFAPGERTLAIGIFNSGSMIGSTIAPPLIVYLAQRHGFRAAFLVPAFLGVLWAPFWFFLYRDPAVRRQGAAASVSLKSLLSESSSWAVMLCRFFIGPVMQFYWYWIPSYLYGVRHLSLTQIGIVGWIPFFLGDTGGIAGGWAAGWLQKRGFSTLRVRQITMYSSSLLCLVSLAVPYLSNVTWAFLLIGIAVMADNFLSANMFGAVTDLFPEQSVGRATGLTGVAGGLSGLLFPLLTGVIVDRQSYAPVFLMVAFMPLLGTIMLFALGKKYRSLR
jgi:ACS family hexuronate transporter-like MFS transporter